MPQTQQPELTTLWFYTAAAIVGISLTTGADGIISTINQPGVFALVEKRIKHENRQQKVV